MIKPKEAVGIRTRRSISFAGDLWANRQLLWQFSLRNVELRHRGTYLGVFWALLNPLLMMLLYVFVFGYIFKGRFNVESPETKIEYALGIFLGLNILHLFAEVVSIAPSCIISNPNFVKKVVFPLSILPAANVASALFHFVAALSLALIGVSTVGPGLTVQVFWLPLIVGPLALLLLGLSWFLATVGVYLRDLSQFVGFLTTVLMFASAVFYSADSIPANVWAVLRFNPLLLAVEMTRDVVLWHHAINKSHLCYLITAGVAAAAVGHRFFRKMAPTFADVV
jgi:lipopolysaccharide transport system permease protein